MRVITGTARGRRLGELEGMETRPTTDRVKEAMFSILQFDLEGRRVLDLFAGTGQLGIECLSRGAAQAVFVDRRADAVKLIREPQGDGADGPGPGGGRGLHGVPEKPPGALRHRAAGSALRGGTAGTCNRASYNV